MNKLIIIFFFLFFALPVFTQTDSTKKNRVYFDVEVASVAFNYNTKLTDKFSIGLAMNIVPLGINRVFTEDDVGNVEVFSMGIPLRYQVNKMLHIEITPRFMFLLGFSNNRKATESVGVSGAVFFGGKIIQYGIRGTLGKSALLPEPIYFGYHSYLILRVNVPSF